MKFTCAVCLGADRDEPRSSPFMCDHALHAKCAEAARVAMRRSARGPDETGHDGETVYPGAALPDWTCPTCRSASREWTRANARLLTADVLRSFARVDVPLGPETGAPCLYHLASNPLPELVWSLSRDLERRDSRGRTALLFATQRGIDPSAILDRANLSAVDDVGNGVEHSLSRFAAVARRGNPERLDARSRTPLFYAALDDAEGASAIWLERGADPLARDDRRLTPLLFAIDRGVPPPDCLLATHGARDCDGGTALHAAYARGDDATVARLLAAGADPTVRDLDGGLARPKRLRLTQDRDASETEAEAESESE